MDTRFTFRFAPSPTGHLHIGHAYSALLNFELAKHVGGRFLLRIEDTDIGRCKPEFRDNLLEDLAWLGLAWDEPMVQSTRFPIYRDSLDGLFKRGLVYPTFLSRAEIKAMVARREDWPHDPDGAPHYPGPERDWSEEARAEAMARDGAHSLRLDMRKALQLFDGPLLWHDIEGHAHRADPAAWGDVILARKDTPTSYHLSVVLDDAHQGVTHVVRGMDLYASTGLHRFLQHLLSLQPPIYHHHRLLLDEDGKKFSKSNRSVALRDLRDAGATPADIRRMIGWDDREIDKLAGQLV